MTPEQIDSLKVGDIIRCAGTGKLRVVRRVNWYSRRFRRPCEPYVNTVTVAISRCSWTHRPYTLLDRWLLNTMYEKAGVRLKQLDSEMDLALAYEIENNDEPKLQCCDVRGIA